MTTTISTLAREAYDALETRTRDDGERFTTTRDDAPEWVRDLVMHAHGDFLPEDWRYETIRDALEQLADGDYETADDAREDDGDFADSAVDVYTAPLLRWLASNLNRPGYVDEARDEGLISGQENITQQITVGQYLEAREVYALVIDALESRAVEVLNADA